MSTLLYIVALWIVVSIPATFSLAFILKRAGE